MTTTALASRGFQSVTDWVGGIMLLVVIVGLVLIDAKVPKSKQVRTRLWSVVGVLGVAAATIVVVRFVALSS